MKWRLIIDSSESPTGLTLSVLGMDITRDDLIRLVVGMQWREWFALFVIDGDGKTISFHPPTNMTDLRPASDIVDEWLGVR